MFPPRRDTIERTVMRTRLLVFAIVLLPCTLTCISTEAASSAAKSDDQTVYRWVDDEGIIHMTSEKPDWWKDEFDLVDDWRTVRPVKETEEEAAPSTDTEEGAGAVEDDDQDQSRQKKLKEPAVHVEKHKTEDAKAAKDNKNADGDESAEPAFVGNKRTKIFHLFKCPLVYRKNRDDPCLIPKSMRITFKNEEEALQGGYRACKICNPVQ